MGFSLYVAVVSPFQQMLGTLAALLDKAESWAAEQGISEGEILAARLAPDMQDFAYQVKSASVHSLGAIQGVQRGTFSPDTTTPGDSFAALRAQLAATRAAIDALVPTEIDALSGREMQFVIGRYHADFSGEDFLTRFSLPNFYFHVSTAYGLLRTRGMPIGKVDYLGKLTLIKDA